VHDHRRPPLLREREHRLELGNVEREVLGARMQLQAPRSRLERALGLGHRLVPGVEPGEGHHSPAGGRGLGDHPVVGLGVAVGLVHGEHRPASAGGLQAADQVLGLASEAVRVVAADVGVHVERLDAR
jgi:hypothetical protein